MPKKIYKYKNISKKFLITEYIKNNKSVTQIAKKSGIHIQTLYHRFRLFNIKLRNHSEAGKIAKHQKTCQCGICKVINGETRGRKNSMFGKMKSGKEAIRYIDGRTLKKYYCKDCEKEIGRCSGFYGKGRCSSCANRITSYINGSSFEPYNIKFNQLLKEQIRKRDTYTCQNCDMTEEEHIIVYGTVLNVHHIDYNKKHSEKENLVTLCKQCNSRVNFNRKYWKEYFEEIIDAI